MSPVQRVRDVQTRVKHELLGAYLDTWAGIIINGLAGAARAILAKGRPFQVRLGYVDGFAFRGRYEGDASDLETIGGRSGPVWASPIVGVQALDCAASFAGGKGFHLDTVSVVVEKNPG